MKILNLENENRKFTKSIENFHVMEYLQDSSVSPMTAMEEYYMSKMNVRRRQVPHSYTHQTHQTILLL